MIEITEKKNCSGCHGCYNVCPIKCITMVEDKEGFLYPEVDKNQCINCGLCEKVCPIINKKERVNSIVAYACINKNENIRAESSSGGIFSLLAENIINQGGLVFGAGFDENFNLVHSYTESIQEISKFRGSKYLQSKIGNTYSVIKEFLEKGSKVLFSGTPCQIDGLISYLGKEYYNLICIDIICHGVPSPKVFKMYISNLENKHRGTTKKITFRCKDHSWRKYSVSIKFSNSEKYSSEFSKDIFMRGFLQNLYLRPSCYDCKSKTLNRLSDITIADFWGIDNIAPELNDDKGTSLVLINSNKGKDIFNQLKDRVISKEVKCNEAIKYNSAAIKSVNENLKREKFFQTLDSGYSNIDELIMKYTKISFSKKIYIKIRYILSRVKKKLHTKHE